MARFVAWWLVSGLFATPLCAQQRIAAGVRPPTAGTTSAWPIVASAILPGSGQAMLAVDRALPYLAVEAFAWTAYVKHSRDYRRRRNGYRDLASRAARAPFSTVRPNGDFAYYERMTHYAETGRYDLVAGGGIEPETDSTTYNGAVWLLARRTYWSDPSTAPDPMSPEWARAMAFYQARAYDQLYRWSWSNAPTEYSMFIDLIRKSNDASRSAMQDLGIVIANHLLSTVDAAIAVRLLRNGGRNGFSFEGSIPFGRSVKPARSSR